MEYCVERGIVGGGAGHHFVIAGEELPGVFGGVEDGEVERVEGQGDGLRFAGCEGDALPSCRRW